MLNVEQGGEIMALSTIWSIITKVIDICIVWFMFYYILKNVKNIKIVEFEKHDVVRHPLVQLIIERYENSN